MIFTSCATAPQNAIEFREMAISKFEKSPIDLKGISFAEAKKRLRDFSKRCLNVQIIIKESGAPRTGPMMFHPTTSVIEQKGSFEERPNSATIFIQRDYGHIPFAKIPDGGYYMMMIELLKQSPRPLAHVYYWKSTLGPTEEAIIKSSSAWISQNKKVCPVY